MKAFLFVVMGGWWVLAAPASHLLMRWGHKQTSGPSALDGLRFAIREGGRTVGAGVVAKVLS
ncbi:hypothetical protein C7K59_01320 [Escherichia coli]|nr:hypothetical protein C7K59_01320 [Escherichia coli]